MSDLLHKKSVKKVEVFIKKIDIELSIIVLDNYTEIRNFLDSNK